MPFFLQSCLEAAMNLAQEVDLGPWKGNLTPTCQHSITQKKILNS